MQNSMDINFVNLGIRIDNLRRSVSIFGFEVAFYGIIIGLGMLAGISIASWDAKRRGQNPDVYLDYAIYGIIFSVIGARIYYVVFSWEDYRGRFLQVFNLRAGGLAIYGGVLAAVLSLLIYTRLKKLSFFEMADTGCIGLITGQIIGRWGNFFNCEAFGGYTEGLFAMQIRRGLVDASSISQELLENMKLIGGVEYIQVHPTFLYESVWNLAILLIMILYKRRQRFKGEILCIYFIGYGLGRVWIEGLRTDQLILFSTGIPVSQLLSMILIAVAAGIMIIGNLRQRRN